jgi:hypothetical protein
MEKTIYGGIIVTERARIQHRTAAAAAAAAAATRLHLEAGLVLGTQRRHTEAVAVAPQQHPTALCGEQADGAV